ARAGFHIADLIDARRAGHLLADVEGGYRDGAGRDVAAAAGLGRAPGKKLAVYFKQHGTEIFGLQRAWPEAAFDGRAGITRRRRQREWHLGRERVAAARLVRRD